jgi:hypothetical protein
MAILSKQNVAELQHIVREQLGRDISPKEADAI